ncbi:MAG: FliM/FliN family flagellar motor switch protein [Candidatus Gastranaerophilaceae bacterium]
MIKQTQKNLETFFLSCSEPIENVLKSFLDSDTCPNLSCKFNEFSEVEMAKELIQDGDVLYKVDFIANNKTNYIYALIPEKLVASISDIMIGGNGKIRYGGVLTEIETNSIRDIVAGCLDEITSYFSLNYATNIIFGSDYSFYLKEMEAYEAMLSDCDLTFVATANINLVDDDKPYPLKILLNAKFISDFMTQLGFDENSTRRNVNNVDLSQLLDIDVKITAEFGQTQLPIKCALELTKDSLVPLDSAENEDIKVYANGLLFAYAQIVAVKDNFGLRLTKIIPPEERMNITK